MTVHTAAFPALTTGRTLNGIEEGRVYNVRIPKTLLPPNPAIQSFELGHSALTTFRETKTLPKDIANDARTQVSRKEVIKKGRLSQCTSWHAKSIFFLA